MVFTTGAGLAHISNSMDMTFCVDCLEDALREHGKPRCSTAIKVANSPAEVFTGVLKREDIHQHGLFGAGPMTTSLLSGGRPSMNVYLNSCKLTMRTTDWTDTLPSTTLNVHRITGIKPRMGFGTSSGGGAVVIGGQIPDQERLPFALRSAW
jgi:hypothetical protein